MSEKAIRFDHSVKEFNTDYDLMESLKKFRLMHTKAEDVIRKFILPNQIFPTVGDYIATLELNERAMYSNIEELEVLDCKNEITSSELKDDGTSYEIDEVFKNL